MGGTCGGSVGMRGEGKRGGELARRSDEDHQSSSDLKASV